MKRSPDFNLTRIPNWYEPGRAQGADQKPPESNLKLGLKPYPLAVPQVRYSNF